MSRGSHTMAREARGAGRWSRSVSFILGSGPARRVWPLTFLALGLGVALTLGWVLDLPQPVVGLTLPWWAYVVIVAAVEAPLIHLHVRSEAHSVTLGEVALCIGLFLVPPPLLVAGAVLGAAIAKCRQAPVKLAFNVALSLLQAATAALVFHAVADVGSPFAARSLTAAFLAMLVVGALGVLAVSGAIILARGARRLRPLVRAAAIAGPVSVANTGLGLVATYLIVEAPQLAPAVAGPLAVLYLTYRAYVAEHQEHERLRVVYATTRAVLEAEEIGGAVDAVLQQARDVFRAEIAQIVVHSDQPGGGVLVSTLGRGDGPGEIRRVPALDRSLFDAVIDTGRAAILTSDEAEALGGFIGPAVGHEVRQVVVAPLTGERRVIGAVAVANRVGPTGRFDASDLVLLETLAGHAGVAIGNGRLEQTLAQLRSAQGELARRAAHDPLTGLANRAHFAATLERALREGETGPVGLVYVDLDDFKAVNDTHGHAAGDHMLRVIADRLRVTLRDRDVAGRLGGDEFAILLAGVSGVEQLSALAERVKERLEAPIVWGAMRLDSRVSLGIALASGDVDAEALLSDGDIAMYHAKRAGKGRSAIYDVAMRDAHTSRAELLAALALAVENGQLLLHYQPIVAVDNGRVVAVEALVRWERPGWGILAPGVFVPLAEEAGLAATIGHWVIREACGQVARWNLSRVGDGELRVAVNVSSEQIDDPEFADRVLEAVHASGLPSTHLTLEIAEGALGADDGRRLSTLATLRGKGVRIALDNFGTGTSNLSALGDAPVDVIKIPVRFVGGDQAAEGLCLAGALVGVGRALGLPSVAEMVETQAQLAAVARLGCGYAQGHAVAQAMPAPEVELWILARSGAGRPAPALRALA